ncbi:MAG: SIS domain-containing protein [Acidobacteriota bacterium]|mgnify:CR=1 FL=1
MSLHYPVIEGRYLGDLLDQPQALHQTLGGLEESSALRRLGERLDRGEFRQVVLTGMGSSYHALHPLLLELTDGGIPATMAETSELVHYRTKALGPGTVIIAVSQSGRSAEIIRLLELNASRSFVVGVTNAPDSPLAVGSDATVLMRAGSEFSVASKTYVASLLALSWLADVLCLKDLRNAQEELASAPAVVSSYLAAWRSHVRDAQSEMTGIAHLFLVGRGASLAAVGTGGLIVKEAAHFHAEGMSAAAFRHGPLDMVNARVFVLVFSGDPRTVDLNSRMAADVTAAGGRAAVVSDATPTGLFRTPPAPPRIRPILEILPVQMLTLGLAAMAGREAGAFGLASKVTAIE